MVKTSENKIVHFLQKLQGGLKLLLGAVIRGGGGGQRDIATKPFQPTLRLHIIASVLLFQVFLNFEFH